jgi:hypothetical protein
MDEHVVITTIATYLCRQLQEELDKLKIEYAENECRGDLQNSTMYIKKVYSNGWTRQQGILVRSPTLAYEIQKIVVSDPKSPYKFGYCDFIMVAASKAMLHLGFGYVPLLDNYDYWQLDCQPSETHTNIGLACHHQNFNQSMYRSDRKFRGEIGDPEMLSRATKAAKMYLFHPNSTEPFIRH